MRWLILALIPVLAIGAACARGGGPEKPLKRFVDAINDADFNDVYQQFTSGCQRQISLDKFQKTYGAFFLAAGIGSTFSKTDAEEKVPLNTVMKVAGTADRPLLIFDDSGEGKWRLDDCDPLGVVRLSQL